MGNKRIYFWLIIAFLASIFFGGTMFGEEVEGEEAVKEAVYVIPIDGQIAKAQLYILRRGLKQALVNEVKTVVMTIDTPGGDLKTTLEMMEALENFDGKVLTFVNTEAISAGAYIAATSGEIYFHPSGILGAAAVIQGTGADIPETMKQKINSYLRARVRSYTSEYRYRGDVVRAMMDEGFEYKIGDVVIKGKGELLTLTAEEAVKEYGEPPERLFGAGIVGSVEELLTGKFGEGGYELSDFVLTWSEELARWLNEITPILLGLGMLLLFIEFKTPGFGVFGLGGISMLLVVFASSYVAGLSGYEEVAVFIIGIALVGVELFILPGVMIAGLLGMVMILGSIVWALADIWPTEDFEYTPELFMGPLSELMVGVVIAVIGVLLVAKYLMKGWLWDILVLKTVISGKGRSVAVTRGELGGVDLPEVGSRGYAITDLHPVGEVEIDGKRFQARVTLGVLEKGGMVEVLEVSRFSLLVKEVDSR